MAELSAKLRRALRTLTGRGAALAAWSEAPAPGRALPWLLPAALPFHPPVAFGLGEAAPQETAGWIVAIRERTLWWPAVIADAPAPAAIVDLRGVSADAAATLLDLLLSEAPAEDALAVGDGPAAALAQARGLDVACAPARISPHRLALAVGPAASPLLSHAALGGVRAISPAGPADPLPWLARAAFVDPWRGRRVGPEEGLAALGLLRDAAQRNDRPVVTSGFSGWKRLNAAPFLTGPAGPPLHLPKPRAPEVARALGARLAVWGAAEAPGDLEVVRMEDGFVRSVGLGLQHVPPASLAVDREGLYYDATRPTDFERIAREARYDPPLLDRAARLRDRLVALRITKYNLEAGTPAALPETDRARILVPGQVEGDASLRFGARGIATNAALIRAARARHPEGFLLYKPHPDVLTGIRPGAVDPETLALADAVVPDVSAEAALGWAERVETMTSLMGFEALLRGRAVTAHGRPFYAGWGLTDAPAPFCRGRTLTLDQLCAAALILYPRYIDPRTRLPCPPELLLEWIDGERSFVRSPRGRARRAWRNVVSRVLNVVR